MGQSFVSISNKMKGVVQMDLSGRNLQQLASASGLFSSREYITSACISEKSTYFQVGLGKLIEGRKEGREKENFPKPNAALLHLIWFGFCLFLFVFCTDKEKL